METDTRLRRMEYFSPGSQESNTNKVFHLGYEKVVTGELEQQLKQSAKPFCCC